MPVHHCRRSKLIYKVPGVNVHIYLIILLSAQWSSQMWCFCLLYFFWFCWIPGSDSMSYSKIHRKQLRRNCFSGTLSLVITSTVRKTLKIMYFPSSHSHERCSGSRWDISAEMRPAEITKVLFVCMTCSIHTRGGCWGITWMLMSDTVCKVWVNRCVEAKTKLAASLFQLFKAELNNIYLSALAQISSCYVTDIDSGG